MAHQSFSDFPPIPYLKQVLEHYPASGMTYIELWQQKDKNHRISVMKKDIRNAFLMSPAKFRTNLLNLAREGLINVNEIWDRDRTTWHKIEIEMTNWDEE